MNLPAIFSTNERVKILKGVLYLSRPFGVNEIAKQLALSKGLVSKILSRLVKENMIKEKGRKFLVQDSFPARAAKILLNLEPFRTNFFKKFPFVKSAGIYGSCTKGRNSEDSDIDLWIWIEDSKVEELAKLTKELKTKHPKINLLYLNKEKWEKIKEEDKPFYYSLFFGSITIFGEELETK